MLTLVELCASITFLALLVKTLVPRLPRVLPPRFVILCDRNEYLPPLPSRAQIVPDLRTGGSAERAHKGMLRGFLCGAWFGAIAVVGAGTIFIVAFTEELESQARKFLENELERMERHHGVARSPTPKRLVDNVSRAGSAARTARSASRSGRRGTTSGTREVPRPARPFPHRVNREVRTMTLRRLFRDHTRTPGGGYSSGTSEAWARPTRGLLRQVF